MSATTAQNAANTKEENEEQEEQGQTFLPLLQQIFPNDNIESYQILNTITQANAKGTLLQVPKNSHGDDNGGDSDNNSNNRCLFVKQVLAEDYAHKPWPDLRRTLLYLRTEARFYNETLPRLESKTKTRLAPRCHHAVYDLDGLIDETDRAVDVSNETPNPFNVAHKGGTIVLEAVPSSQYTQDSPLSLPQVQQCLRAVARMHAAAWQDETLLTDATNRLSRGSYHLQMRAPKEMDRMEEAWSNFQQAFQSHNPELFRRDSIRLLGERILAVAEEVSQQLSPGPDDPYATLVHGDYKAMNVFLSKHQNDDNENGDGIMIDFASTGVGIGMSDVGFLIYHALRPKDIINNEAMLLDGYLEAFHAARQQCADNSATSASTSGPIVEAYPRDVALKHFQLAVIDYFRFFLGRFWFSATPETMERKKNSKNTNLINRDIEAALAYVETVDKMLTEYENDKKQQQQQGRTAA